MLNRRLFFFSPVPPAKTGTATYLFSLLPPDCYPPPNTYFIINCEDYQKPPHEFLGVPCINYDDVRLKPNDISVFFIANNEFHQYIIAYLKKPKIGTYISWIHELQIFQNMLGMALNNKFQYTLKDLEEALKPEFGYLASQIINDIQKGNFENFFTYTILCLKDVLEKSDLIVTHSIYAKLKLLLESGTYRNIPPILVAKHPEKPKNPENFYYKKVASEVFQIGIFGWVNPHKRVIEAISAFNTFWSSLPPDDKEKCILKIVGELPPKEYYDPVGFSKNLESSHNIHFTGFLDDKDFDEELKKTQVILNLRFPSCGESSGILHKARGFGIPIAISDFQAFREELSDALIPVHPEAEQKALIDFLNKTFLMWKQHKITHSIIPNQNKIDKRFTAQQVLKKIYNLMEAKI